MSKSLLAIGAHYDDCVFGLPGILLQAVRKHCRVVVVAMIGDYTNWPPVHGRDPQLLETAKQLAAERGIEMRFLPYASMHFEPNEETRRAVAEIVAEVAPDTAFMLWPRDRHPDHEAASAIAHMALHQPGGILRSAVVHAPRQIFAFDNGPGHTIGFEPNTFVDITPDWPAASEWLGRLMAFVQEKPFDPQAPGAAIHTKEILAQYRGLACGAKYAEAVWASNAHVVEILG